MKAHIRFLALATAVASSPAFAQTEAALVMWYRAPDGEIKSIPSYSTDGTTMRECKATFDRQVPVLKRQLADKQNFPEFAGWEFVGASCEIFTEDLLTTVE